MSSNTVAAELHKNALVINALDCTAEENFTAAYVDVLQAGGVNAINLTIPSSEDDFQRAIEQYTRWRRRLFQIGDRILIVSRARDILKAKREGKVAVIFGFQNAKPIEDALGLVDVFYRLDIRIVQLTYQRRNFVGNGVGERGDEGLSRFGLLLVRELNKIGIVIDLSHVAQRSALDAVEASGAPVIISHTAAKALVPHFRNVSDDLIRAVASRGGCVGIAALSVFLREDGIERGSHLEDYLDHMEHAIGVAGIDHVGVGFDIGYEMSDEHVRRAQVIYPEFKLPPMRLQHAAEVNRLDKMPNLTVGLLNRGYSETDIKKLLGQNWYRIFAKIWGESTKYCGS